jgi:hypothetical protein
MLKEDNILAINSVVKVTELNISHGRQIRLRLSQETTWESNVEDILQKLTEDEKKNFKKLFFLEWNGSKVPHYAVIDKTTVAWTQRGIVTDEKRQAIGWYKRLIPSDKKNGGEQQMLIFKY